MSAYRRRLTISTVDYCSARAYWLQVAKYALREPGGYDFTPLVVESYDCQCSATHTLLNLLGRLAGDSGSVTKAAWAEAALR